MKKGLVSRSGDSPRESAPPSTLDAPVEQQEPTRIPQPARHAQRGAGTDSHHHTHPAAGMSVATNLRTGTLGRACRLAGRALTVVFSGAEVVSRYGRWQ